MNTCPMGSTAFVLEQWVRVLLVVAGVPNQTKMAQGHVVRMEELVVVSVETVMGLVPGFAGYPSSTTVESEWVAVAVVAVAVKVRTHLSDDKDAVEDVGSGLEGSKRWGRGG